jgi:hypothetical protein
MVMKRLNIKVEGQNRAISDQPLFEKSTHEAAEPHWKRLFHISGLHAI